MTGKILMDHFMFCDDRNNEVLTEGKYKVDYCQFLFKKKCCYFVILFFA